MRGGDQRIGMNRHARHGPRSRDITEVEPRDRARARVSVRVDRDARVGRRWGTDSEQLPRNKLVVDNHTATTRNPIILSDWREERGTTYLNPTVVIPPFNLPCSFPLSSQ
jgi:hypothetical protein